MKKENIRVVGGSLRFISGEVYRGLDTFKGEDYVAGKFVRVGRLYWLFLWIRW
ncbi:MAG: hypothetical protein ABH816_03045 [Candidatus Levyibacteriota bacterium]